MDKKIHMTPANFSPLEKKKIAFLANNILNIIKIMRVCDYFCKINFSMIKYLVLFEQISKIQLIESV